MRALGAQRGYIRKMFLAETMALTVFFGLLGSALALGTHRIAQRDFTIPAGNNLMELLFGGKVLHLVPASDRSFRRFSWSLSWAIMAPFSIPSRSRSKSSRSRACRRVGERRGHRLIKIAFRNLSRQKKRSFLLAEPSPSASCSSPSINGFAGAFVNNLAGNMADLFAGHVFVEGVEKSASKRVLTRIRDDSVIIEALKASGVDSRLIQKRSATETTIVFEGKKANQTIMGADFAGENYLRSGSFSSKGNTTIFSSPSPSCCRRKSSKNQGRDRRHGLLSSSRP
jgi:hypothetical protein